MSDTADQTIVIVRIAVPRFAPRWLVRRKMRATTGLYSSIPGLSFKLFTFERTSGDFGGIYTWRDREAARAWFDEAWFERVRRERGSEPFVRLFDAPVSIDNVPGGTPMSSGGGQVATLVEIPVPDGVTRELVIAGFAAAEPTYRSVPGLLRKHFVLSERGTFGGVYLWDSAASAQAWFDEAWRTRVRERSGADPVVEWFDVPIVLPAAAGLAAGEQERVHRAQAP
jgi:heme-degrading monooxygenase HmoA